MALIPENLDDVNRLVYEQIGLLAEANRRAVAALHPGYTDDFIKLVYLAIDLQPSVSVKSGAQ